MAPTTRRRLLAALGSLVGTAGCLGGEGATSTPTWTSTPTRTTTPTATRTRTESGPSDARVVAGAPLPEDPSQFTYASMGPADAPTVTYFGHWKCPKCAGFSTGLAEGLSLADVVTDYVRPGRIRLQFRCLAYLNGEPVLGPDGPRAARAGLAVWTVDPADFWAYYAAVMHNQPPESRRWATAERLLHFAEISRVDDLEAVAARVDSDRYADALRATTTAAARAGIRGTPSLVAGGTVTTPANEKRARSAIESIAR